MRAFNVRTADSGSADLGSNPTRILPSPPPPQLNRATDYELVGRISNRAPACKAGALKAKHRLRRPVLVRRATCRRVIWMKVVAEERGR